LLELGALLGDRYRTRPIDGIDQLSGAGPTPWLLIIDATARSDARAQAARVEQHYPFAPVLVVCADGRTADWASALERGMVSAVVERGTLQSGALGEALAAAERRLPASAAGMPSAAGIPSAMQNLEWPGKSAPRRSWWLLVVPALLLGAVGAWYAVSGRMDGFGGKTAAPAGDELAAPATVPAVPATEPAASAASGPAAAAETTASAAPQRTVLELLSDARVAFSEGRNLLPRTDGAVRGDSALELYAAVLAQDAQNEEARDGVRRLYSVARSRIQADLSAGRLDEATRLLAAFRAAGVASDATAKLEADIAAARPRWLIAQARAALASGDTATAATLIGQIEAGGADRAVLADLRRALESRSSEAQLTELAARARAAINAGALLEPAADNARSRVEAMQKLNRAHPLTLTLQRELQAALLARMQAAVRGSQLELAQQLLGAAGELGNSAELASARKLLQSESDAARARTVAATAAANEAAKPADTDAAAPPDFIRARPVKPLAAAFPQRALDAGQRGYVVVEFTLDAKGRASELQVVEASLPGVFDASAMQAVRSGRYDTAALGASGQPRRARLRVAFK
jgi:TonB family protein